MKRVVLIFALVLAGLFTQNVSAHNNRLLKFIEYICCLQTVGTRPRDSSAQHSGSISDDFAQECGYDSRAQFMVDLQRWCCDFSWLGKFLEKYGIITQAESDGSDDESEEKNENKKSR